MAGLADSLQRVICDWITSKEITEKYLIGIRSEAYKKTQPNCKIENGRKQKTSQVTAKLRGREQNRVPPLRPDEIPLLRFAKSTFSEIMHLEKTLFPDCCAGSVICKSYCNFVRLNANPCIYFCKQYPMCFIIMYH